MNFQWPFVIAVAVMSMAGISQALIRRVPNLLTMTSFLWALLACWITPSPLRATGLALLCSACSFVVMLPAYGKEVASGSLKAQMSFAAWLGVGMSFGPNTGASLSVTCVLIAYAFMMLCLKSSVIRDALSINEADRNEPGVVRNMFQAQLPLSLANGVCVIGFLLQH